MIKSVWLKKQAYKVLSLFFKNGLPVTINDVSLKLPVDYFRLFPKDYEKENFEFVKNNVKQGDVVLDIGAHIGLMGTLFGKIVKDGGKVFSFEPTPQSFQVLSETIRINKLTGIVTPVNMPVTQHSGKVSFFVSDNNVDVANTLTPWEKEKKLNSIEIMATSIDDFVEKENLSRVDFIKIDAEGVELSVLKGGLKTIGQFKPKINLALHPDAILSNKDSLEEIYDVVEGLQYSIHFEGKKLDKPAFCAIKKLFDVHLFAN